MLPIADLLELRSKRCSACRELKADGEFHRLNCAPDGLQYACKACNRARMLAAKAKDPSRAKAVRAACRAKPENAAKELASHKLWLAANKARVAGKSAAWKKSNALRVKAELAEWRLANKERTKIYRRNRRAKLRAINGRHTPEDIQNLFKRQRGQCAVCRVGVAGCFQVDHVVALKNGGSNGPENLQLLCRSCNQSKHAKDPVVFMQSRGFLL